MIIDAEWWRALHEPVTTWTLVAIGACLVGAPIIILALGRLKVIGPQLRLELLLRCGTWAVLVPLIVGPILLGTAFVVAAVGLLSLGCYREYARATGLFRHRLIHVLVLLGIGAVTFAAATNDNRMLLALWPLVVGLIVTVSILPDRPRGYLQRTSLGVLGFALFGACLGYVGFFANDDNFRPILMWLLVGVELNDVFAFLTGKLIGGPRLRPNTSPNKTLSAAVAPLLLTTALVATIGHFVFAGQPIDTPVHLVSLGLIVSVAGQLGDLVLSSIKRDLGIKDMAAALPGHGGLLDRFDSLVLTAPAVYCYIAFFQGVGGGEPHRMIAGL